MQALLDARPGRSPWPGRRDYALVAGAIEAGLRLSEIVNPTVSAVTLALRPTFASLEKAANKVARSSPLRPPRSCANGWESAEAQGQEGLVPTRRGRPLLERSRCLWTSTPSRPLGNAVSDQQTRHAPRAPPYQLDALTSSGRRHPRDRPVPRPCLGHESTKSTEIYPGRRRRA